MLFKFTDLDAAKDQLNCAIHLLVNCNALIPSITLAGAAEEILSKNLPQDRSAFGILKKQLSEEFPDISVSQELNRLKNAFKHWERDDANRPVDTIEAELEVQAAIMIFRAMLNLRHVDRSLPHEYEKFIAWCKSQDFHKSSIGLT